MDQNAIRYAFFLNRVHNTILYSSAFGTQELAGAFIRVGLDDLFTRNLEMNELRIFSSGRCPVFIFYSEWFIEEDLTAVEALTYLLTEDVVPQTDFKAHFFLARKHQLEKVVSEFLEHLKKGRNVLTASRDGSKAYYADMKRSEILTYVLFSPKPLPGGLLGLI